MVIRIGTGKRELGKIVSYGHENREILDRFCALLLAFAPILQHYKGLYENAGFTAILFAFPVLTLRLISRIKFKKLNMKCLAAISPLLFFEIYTAIDHSVTVPKLLYILFMMWVLICIASGCVNTAFFLQYATSVISVAAILLAGQYISHYLFRHTINLRPFQLLVSQDVIWVRHAQEAANVNRMYRPAAFFLEPSHLFLYSFPVLCLLLLAPNMTKWRGKKAIMVTAALLLSTSGFGIMVSIGLWALYLLLYKNSEERRTKTISKLLSPRTLVVAAVLILGIILAYFFVPIFQRSVNRIFFNTEGSTAIEGRVRLAINYISSITGPAVIFGAANVASSLDFNLAGFFATYIKWGIIGLVLTYWFYGQGLVRLKKTYFWMSLIIIVISFFTAHTHGTFYMLYYVVLLMNGYAEIRSDRLPSKGAAEA